MKNCFVANATAKHSYRDLPMSAITLPSCLFTVRKPTALTLGLNERKAKIKAYFDFCLKVKFHNR